MKMSSLHPEREVDGENYGMIQMSLKGRINMDVSLTNLNIFMDDNKFNISSPSGGMTNPVC